MKQRNAAIAILIACFAVISTIVYVAYQADYHQAYTVAEYQSVCLVSAISLTIAAAVAWLYQA